MVGKLDFHQVFFFVFIKTAKYGESTVINSERALSEAQEKVKRGNRVVGCRRCR